MLQAKNSALKRTSNLFSAWMEFTERPILTVAKKAKNETQTQKKQRLRKYSCIFGLGLEATSGGSRAVRVHQ